MEQKIKDSLNFIDMAVSQAQQAQREAWLKTTTLRVGLGVKVIYQDMTLWGRIKQALYNKLVYPRFVFRASDPLWTILHGNCCKLLTVVNSAETYKPYLPQELRIISVHQELSATRCIGSTDVYHKEQLISRVEWHLTLLDDEVILDVEYPVAISSLVYQSVLEIS